MIDVLAAAGWTVGWLAAGRIHRLPPAPVGITSGPPVRTSVVVPARDEAARLPGLLAALATEPPATRPAEIIVVDDGSTDGTAALATAAGAAVIAVEPPPGWTGKAWACWQGARAATGDVVVFLDADTRPAPGFAARLAAAVAATDGLVSVQPTHRVVRRYERASAACNAVALMAGTGTTPGGAAAHPGRWWRRPVAFGPALAVPRRRYLDAGGHGLVRADVADDLALAAALDRAGMPVSAYADAGQGAIYYRMYPEGPATLVEGWSKNLAAGAGKLPPLRTVLVALWIAGALHVAINVAANPIAYGLYVLQAGVLFRRAGRFGVVATIAYPLPVVAFVALFIRSAACRVRHHPVAWRGRTVTP